jgi:CRP/FNR family transcriptional regulator/CRP/FNR family cyclic AMP-dependent transcriptional regulator
MRQLMDLAGTLRDVLPIHILPQADKEELARSMRLRRFDPNEVIFHQGDPAGDACVVFSGLVKMVIEDAEGREALVALHGRGEFFGELALFTEEPREATAIAVMSTQVFQLSRASCTTVIERNAEARDWMFEHLARIIQQQSQRYGDMVFLDVPGRVAKYLLELGHIGGQLPITQEDLASAVGSTRATVNKLLADFERRGMLRVDRRRFEIVDPRALEAVVHH